MPTKRAILLFHEIWHFDSSWMTRSLLESFLFPIPESWERFYSCWNQWVFSPRKLVKKKKVPVGHGLCLVLQLSDGLQVDRTKFCRWKCSYLCSTEGESAHPSSAKAPWRSDAILSRWKRQSLLFCFLLQQSQWKKILKEPTLKHV